MAARQEALEECHPQVSCWEEATANFDEALNICATLAVADREICEKEAKEVYMKH